jgi:hypothetical protein
VGFKVVAASIFMLNKFGVDGCFFGIPLLPTWCDNQNNITRRIVVVKA